MKTVRCPVYTVEYPVLTKPNGERYWIDEDGSEHPFRPLTEAEIENARGFEESIKEDENGRYVELVIG